MSWKNDGMVVVLLNSMADSPGRAPASGVFQKDLKNGQNKIMEEPLERQKKIECFIFHGLFTS